MVVQKYEVRRSFNIYRDAKNRDALVYYARVVSPGTFTADGTIIQEQ